MRKKHTLYYILDIQMWIIFICCGQAQADRLRAILTAGPTTIPVGGSVALSCSVDNSAGWKYRWFRSTADTLPVQIKNDNQQNKIINVTQGGFYQCKGVSETGNQQSHLSNRITIKIIFSNKVAVTRHPNWPQMFSGETISLTCEVQGGETTEWTFEWRRDGSFIHMTHEKNLTFSVSESNSGDYRCLCLLKDGGFSSTEWSEPISVSVSGKPKAHLSTDSTELPVGGNVTLTCSLNTSSSSSFSWKYFWYRGEKSSEPLTREWTDGQVSVSEEGLYWCRGGRGEPVYYTDYSDPIHIMSVESSGPVGSSLFVLLVVALLGGVSLVILLLLFWRSRQMKDLGHMRLTPSQSPSQSFTNNHEVNQSETYTSPPQVNDTSLGLPLRTSEVNRNGKSIDTVYSLTELKNSGTKRSPHDPEEGALWSHARTTAIGLRVGPEVGTVYANVKKEAADTSINTVYSQIERKNVGMMKHPVIPEEGAVYANVKKGATDKSIDTVYSLTDMKNFGTMTENPHDPQEGAVGSDVKTDSTTASTDIIHLKKAKKKTKGKRSRSADAEVYANVKSGRTVTNDGPMSRKPKKH
uniref:Ig-like domain-containing protein n=1 Tax=Poecilia mexicana TaxID=48701 RepID=A0A3B3YL69_9TELE